MFARFVRGNGPYLIRAQRRSGKPRQIHLPGKVEDKSILQAIEKARAEREEVREKRRLETDRGAALDHQARDVTRAALEAAALFMEARGYANPGSRGFRKRPPIDQAPG